MSRKHLFPVLLLAAAPLVAQDADPPSRVARLNLVEGSVSFRPASVDEWTAATPNYPLTIGDHLWADSGSRVEIHTDSAAIRMGQRTAISILNLDDRTVQLSLTDGALHVRLRDLAEDESFEIDTPNVAITLLRAGDYRIDADGDSNTTSVTVRAGNAQVTGGGAAFTVRPRETVRAVGMDEVREDRGPALPRDDFDSWCEARDRADEDAHVSAQYVPPDMIGYQDLDRYGVWNEMPDYGWVWRPTAVEIGWAPYRYGHWAWIEPWGWTWIDDAPWGFAPFHYGRWAMAGGIWVWVPGRMTVGVRPVYAPALVVFVGMSRAGVAAWFPLGPREVYRPVYHASEPYMRRVNWGHSTNVTVINTVYVNQRIPGAVTAVSRETFVRAGHIGRGALRVDEREVIGARVIGTAAPIAPERASALGGGRPVSVRTPARVFDRQVVVRRTPPPPPVSFEARRPALEAQPGRPLDRGEMDRFRGRTDRAPAVRVAPAAPVQESPGTIPRDERAPLRRVERPSAPAAEPAPRPERPRFERPVPAPQAAPRPSFERPVPAAQPAPRPERPRFERPVPAPQLAPRIERPAPEERRPAAESRGEGRDGRKGGREGKKEK